MSIILCVPYVPDGGALLKGMSQEVPDTQFIQVRSTAKNKCPFKASAFDYYDWQMVPVSKLKDRKVD